MIDIGSKSFQQVYSIAQESGFGVWPAGGSPRTTHITIYLNEDSLQRLFDTLTKATWRVNVQTHACEIGHHPSTADDRLIPFSVVASGMIVMTKKEACRFLGQIVRGRILKARVFSNRAGLVTVDFLPFVRQDLDRMPVDGDSE